MSGEDVVWSELDLTLGHMSRPAPTSLTGFAERWRALRIAGDAYLELAPASRPHPLLAVSLRGGFGVLHGFRSQDSVALLAAQSPVRAGPLWMPVLDTETSFSPEFVHCRADACAAVERFIECAELPGLGRWVDL